MPLGPYPVRPAAPTFRRRLCLDLPPLNSTASRERIWGGANQGFIRRGRLGHCGGGRCRQERPLPASPIVNVPAGMSRRFMPIEFVNTAPSRSSCGLGVCSSVPGAGRVHRLPTEAEWEYACRAGPTTKYPFWDDEKLLGDSGWFAGNADDQTHPVGLKKPNRWRLYDMHGNVLKWLSDWYDPGYYASSSREDPLRSSAVARRVHRGGSYSSYANVCGGAYRHISVPAYQWRSLGFRLAMSVP